jgi:outer membrane protein assembly factor BamB
MLIVFSFASVCMPRTIAAEPLVSGQLLSQAGLEQIWQVKLAIKPGEQIEKISVLGNEICALTSRNYLYCLNRNSGKVLFGLQLANPGFPVLEPRRYNDELLIVAGNSLMQINALHGTVTDKTKIDYTVICPIVRNNDYFYIAGIDDRIHAVDVNMIPMFMAAADDGSMPTSVIAENDYVAFATDKGDVICISPIGPQLLWQYETKGKITAGLVKDGNDIYAASADTRIYKFDALRGRIIWEYQLGGIPKHSPRITHDTVYQYVADKGVTAINKQTGEPLWTVDTGIDLLAQFNGRACVMTCDGTMVVMDNETGKQAVSLNFAQACLGSPNTIDGKIYIAGRAGCLACITAAK